MERGSKMSAPSTSGLSVELLLRVIDVKYGCFTLLYFYFTLLVHVWYEEKFVSVDMGCGFNSCES